MKLALHILEKIAMWIQLMLMEGIAAASVPWGDVHTNMGQMEKSKSHLPASALQSPSSASIGKSQNGSGCQK